MKQILIGLTASAALLSAIGSAYSCNRADTAQNSVSSGPLIQLAQASGGSGNGTSSGGKAVDQQFIDPSVQSAPGQTTAPSGSAGSTDTTGSTTPDASQSKRKVTDEPEASQSGSK
jgi:hypothetical protein